MLETDIYVHAIFVVEPAQKMIKKKINHGEEEIS